jgi:hypothetical protein
LGVHRLPSQRLVGTSSQFVPQLRVGQQIPAPIVAFSLGVVNVARCLALAGLDRVHSSVM